MGQANRSNSFRCACNESDEGQEPLNDQNRIDPGNCYCDKLQKVGCLQGFGQPCQHCYHPSQEGWEVHNSWIVHDQDSEETSNESWHTRCLWQDHHCQSEASQDGCEGFLHFCSEEGNLRSGPK